MKIYRDIAQGTPEWDKLRLGSIGGSSISMAVAKGEGKTRETLKHNLVEEILSGIKKDHFVSWQMKNGIKFEPDARTAYEIRTGIDVDQIALVKNSDHKHYSPDGLIDPDGMIEIKIRIFEVWAEFKSTRSIPTSDRRQMQWGMFLCERDYCDYVTFCPYIERKVDSLIIIRVERDEKEIQELNAGADKFIEELQSLLIKVMKGV